jgi:hypothetical protein
MSNIKYIKGIKRSRKAKGEALCVITIASGEGNTLSHYNRIEDLRYRLDRIKAEASKRGYRFIKTEWATSIIESEVRKLEKEFGLKY